jgi:soluble lytic murein transglycosylase-like protein
MTWRALRGASAVLCAVLTPGPGALAQPVPPAAVSVACRDAAAIAEQQQGLPPGLLLAIGRQESGRWDPVTGQILPWPFSVNTAGESRFFATRQEAAGFVAARRAAGVQSIDVGCFQINLRHHPGAFASLDEALDPTANARYAASFLSRLHAETGNWEAAAGRYHSATAALADPYRSAVLSLWASGGAARERTAAAAGRGPWRQVVAGVAVQRPGAAMLVPAGPGLGLPLVITPFR